MEDGGWQREASWSAAVLCRFLATSMRPFASKAPEGWRSPKPGGVSCAVLVLALRFRSFLSAASAQSYSIDWSKVAGGGGTSTGGVYSVSGTIGQHDAGGPMTGGTYSLTGGFWALYAVQTPGAPTLRIFLTSTNTAVVAWPQPSTGWSLQQNSDLRPSGWTNAAQTPIVVGNDNQVIISPPAGKRFYRLSQ